MRLGGERKVVGIGWAKTGTTTLGACLETLGFRHCGQRMDLVECLRRDDLAPILRTAERFDSFDDWPWILLHRRMDDWFPGSRFVLTVRSPDRWLRSYRNMLRNSRAGRGIDQIRSFLYGLSFPDVTDDELMDRYRRHREDVTEYFQDRPEQLLVVDWEQGAGWSELCAFLEVPCPDAPFPHANKGAYS